MNIRNSLKSIIRTPVKSSLFLMLIAAVTAFLYLALNTWYSSVAMLRDAEDNYTTIVTLKYRDTYGASAGYQTAEMKEDAAKIDFQAIADNENVRLWQPADIGFGTSEGFVSKSRDPEYAFTTVMVVKDLRKFADDSPYAGKLVDTLYSFRDYKPGRTVFIRDNFEEIGFEPDEDALYVIHANIVTLDGNGISLELVPFINNWAEASGIDTTAIKPFLEIESEADLQTQEAKIYQEIANYYTAMNQALSVNHVTDPASLEEFHQQVLFLESGRLFTQEEAQAGEKLAVISRTIADRQELDVGDDLTILLPDQDTSSYYEWGMELSREETYRVVGIVNYVEEYHKNIYIPPTSYANHGSQDPNPVGSATSLGQATIKNGTADAFLADLEPYLSDNILVNVYDQGYEIMANAVHVVQNAAIALSLVALLVTLAVLVFFSTQYTDSQRETVGIMRSFGATKHESRLYLMAGAVLILVLAIVLGIAIGIYYAEDLVVYALNFVADLQVIDSRYSDSFRGLVKPFQPVVRLSYGFAVGAGAVILLAALGFALFFAERTISGRMITHRAKTPTLRPVKKSSVALSGPLRHAVLAIRRDKGRSLLTVTLTIVALLFVASLQATLSSYASAKAALYNDTSLRGYTAKMDGLFTDRMALRNSQAIDLRDTPGLGDVAYTYQLNYQYLGIAQRADGSPGNSQEMPVITSMFEWENIVTSLYIQPNLVFTDQVRQAPEFLFTDFQAEFMEGWDEGRFGQRNWDILPVIISTDMKATHGIEYGDTIRIYTQDHLWGPFFQYIRPMEMQVVGSFTRVADLNNMYAPLPLGALDPENSTLRDLDAIDFPPTTGTYLSTTLGANDLLREEDLTDQQKLDIILDNYYISSLTFQVPDPADLTMLKDALEEKGYSGPDMPNDLRITIVIEDSQFLEAVNSIDQRSRYLELLYPVLLVLTSLLGLLTGFLAVKARRENIALMRAIGARKSTIFATIFGEQAILLLLGGAIAIVLWLLLRGSAELSSPATYAFLISYALSVLVSTLFQNRKPALAIMSEKE